MRISRTLINTRLILKYILLCLLFLLPLQTFAFDWPTQVGRLAIRYNVDPQLALAIIKCESNFNPEAVHHNQKSTDYGLMQINSLWWSKASKMGLDVRNDPIDNLTFGFYLLSQDGTSDYDASEWCWSKKLSNYEMFDAVGTTSLPRFLARN